jgi:uncharacterized MAPEG superfamily protein
MPVTASTDDARKPAKSEMLLRIVHAMPCHHEAFAPFAAIVIVAHLTGKADGMTAFWAAWFFWMRLAHAVVYLTAIPYVRTLVFTLGYVAVLGIFWEVIK